MSVYQDQAVQLLQGDVLAILKTLPDEYVQTVVTSPPYWGLRDYGVEGQLGLEKTPEAYVAKMVDVFREVRRVLKDDGLVHDVSWKRNELDRKRPRVELTVEAL